MYIKKIITIEKTVIETMLGIGSDYNKILYSQFANCENKAYNQTKCGFFVKYITFDNIYKNIKGDSFEISNVDLSLDGKSIDVVLFVRNGSIDMLECVTYGMDEFPDDFNEIHCSLTI